MGLQFLCKFISALLGSRPSVSKGKEVSMATTGWKYAEYEGNTYRWPESHDLIKMERWEGDSWGEMLFGTDIRTKVIHFGVKLTPKHVVRETGSKDSIQ